MEGFVTVPERSFEDYVDCLADARLFAGGLLPSV
jgi:hypothetical protein